jgi:hypothetical protein
VLSTWRPFIKVIQGNSADSITIDQIQVHTGCRTGYREPNLITFENGAPVRDTNGDYFVSATHQFPTSQLNSRSLASCCWGIYRYDVKSMRLTLAGTMYESRAGSTYGFAIGKILFDRNDATWKIWGLDVGSRPFLSSDGTDDHWWNHYYETALCPLFGVTVLDYDNAGTDLAITGMVKGAVGGTNASAGDTCV